MTYLYQEDRTASLAANYITGQQYSLTYDAKNDFHYFIPKAAPFFAKDFRIREITSTGSVPLVEGSGFHFGGEFKTASMSTGKPVYSAVVLTNLSKDTLYEIDYRTLGGEWTLDESALTAAIANVVLNPRGLSWEQIANVPGMLSPTAHYWNWQDMVGLQELVAAIVNIGSVINAKTADGNTNLVNLEDLNKFHFGLDKVPNYGMASLLEAVGGERNDVLLSPLTLFAALDSLNVLQLRQVVAQLQQHLSQNGNVHNIDKRDLALEHVPNLPLATADDIAGNRSVDKLISLRQLQTWWSLHGGDATPKINYPKAGAVLQSYCRTPDRYEMIADGNGGTYERLQKTNDVTCGFISTLPVQFPPKGEQLTTYCSNGNLMALIADGYGGAVSNLKEVNAQSCKIEGTVPAAGTVLAIVCTNGTLVKTIANGSGGVLVEEVANATECLQTNKPPAGEFIRYECDPETHHRMRVEADGNGGERKTIQEMNVVECGYVAPTTPPIQTYPPQGTSIGKTCGSTEQDKYTWYDIRANGTGGQYLVPLETNSVANCGYMGTPAPTTSPTPAPTSAPREGSIQFSTTHTVIYIGDTEVQTIRLYGWNPNTSYSLEIWGNSTDWGTPYERKLDTRPIQTDSSGNAVMYITAKETGIVPVGTYTSWFRVKNAVSNAIVRRFMGNR